MNTAESLRSAIALVQICEVTDTGDLTPLQAADLMKQVILGCLEGNLRAIELATKEDRDG